MSMFRKKINLLFFTVILVFFATVFLVLSDFQRGPHDFEGRCDYCHLGLKQPEVLKGSPDYLCKNCHKNVSERSHPSDFFPSRKLPAAFPLFAGKMTCITCHYAHRAYSDSDLRKKRADNYPYLLRYKTAGKAFCIQCHSIDDICDDCGNYHSDLGIAHLKTNSPEILRILDRSSRDCMSCHNGVIASMAGDETSLEWNHSQGIGLSHPIGVDYASVYMKHPKYYYPPSALPEQIRLINGKVECLTCHDHYSKYKGKLVMSNRKSRLCLSCHNL